MAESDIQFNIDDKSKSITLKMPEKTTLEEIKQYLKQKIEGYKDIKCEEISFAFSSIKNENKKEIETLEIQKNNSTLRAIKREPFILKLVRLYIQFEIIDPPNETIYLEMPRETTIEMIKFHIKYNIDGYQNLRPKDMMFLINGEDQKEDAHLGDIQFDDPEDKSLIFVRRKHFADAPSLGGSAMGGIPHKCGKEMNMNAILSMGGLDMGGVSGVGGTARMVGFAMSDIEEKNKHEFEDVDLDNIEKLIPEIEKEDFKEEFSLLQQAKEKQGQDSINNSGYNYETLFESNPRSHRNDLMRSFNDKIDFNQNRGYNQQRKNYGDSKRVAEQREESKFIEKNDDNKLSEQNESNMIIKQGSNASQEKPKVEAEVEQVYIYKKQLETLIGMKFDITEEKLKELLKINNGDIHNVLNSICGN